MSEKRDVFGNPLNIEPPGWVEGPAWWVEEVERQQARFNYNPNAHSKYDHDPRTDQEKALDQQGRELPPIEPPPGYGNRMIRAMQGCQEDEAVKEFLTHERQFEVTSDELPPLGSMGPNMQEYDGPEPHMPEPPLLDIRQQTHGSFASNARIAQHIKATYRKQEGWNALDDRSKEALDMIAGKISRILSGHHTFKDHWDDIAGYANLAGDPNLQR